MFNFPWGKAVAILPHYQLRHRTEADSFFRNFNEATEWKLNTNLFHKTSSMFGSPTLDLSASRINHQTDRHYSWFLFNQIENWVLLYLPLFELVRESDSKNLHRQKESHWSDPKITHATLVPQPLEKNDEKHDYDTMSKKFGTTSGSTKSSSTTSKASPTSAPDRLTTQDIINAS